LDRSNNKRRLTQ